MPRRPAGCGQCVRGLPEPRCARGCGLLWWPRRDWPAAPAAASPSPCGPSGQRSAVASGHPARRDQAGHISVGGCPAFGSGGVACSRAAKGQLSNPPWPWHPLALHSAAEIGQPHSDPLWTPCAGGSLPSGGTNTQTHRHMHKVSACGYLVPTPDSSPRPYPSISPLDLPLTPPPGLHPLHPILTTLEALGDAPLCRRFFTMFR